MANFALADTLSHMIVYQSLYGVLLALSYFFVQGKYSVFQQASASRCLLSKAFQKPYRKNYMFMFGTNRSFTR